MSLPSAGVYRRPFAFNRQRAASAVAAESRGHATVAAAARSIAGAIAAQTGATTVAMIAAGVTVVVHHDGHDLAPLSPSAAAAVQGDPARTTVLPLHADSLPKPASLIVIGADPSVDLGGLAEIAALGIDLASMMEAARGSDRMAMLKGEFVAHVSHELRAPLTTIVGALQTIQRMDSADPRAGELRASALEGASRLRRLVEDLLVATRIDGRGVPVRFALVQVTEVVDRAIGDVPNATGVTVTVKGQVPKTTTDEEHLRRIVTNLVDNAVRHGGAVVAVDITAADGVVVTVTDHGPGLPPLVAADLFAGNHPSGSGLGLGLRIAGGLADAVGAGLTHRVTPGGGATFRLHLPGVRG